MKKRIFCFLAAFCLAASVSACKHSVKGTEKKLSIVTTIFPEYDWVMSILGEEKDTAEVTMLLDNGVDLHSYQPSAEDILKITSCDMFIYVGGESDEWVEDVLKESSNKDMVVIDLLDVLGDQVKEEEVVEGMEHEHDHDHEEHDHDEDNDHEEHEHDEDHDHEHEEVEYDEHVWLSLRNAKTLCVRIESELEKLDPAHKDNYKKNLDAYVAELEALDAEYQKVVDSAAKKTILFADRFPFRYLADDYGLSYYAAFTGCSAESEASFETIVFLAQKVDELDLNVVLTIEGAKHKIAETVVENASKEDVKILTMDSLQSVTGSDVKNGTAYISVMRSNLDVLKEALS